MKYVLIGIAIGVLLTMGFMQENTMQGYMLREEGAVVALRLLHGVDYRPPEASGDVFADMTNVDYWGTKWAEQAYKDGLFVGCGEKDGKPMFCPGGGQ